MDELNKIAEDIIVASREKTQLDHIETTIYNKKYPVFTNGLFLIPHKEAIELINDLRCFYAVNSPQDIKKINRKIAGGISKTSL